MKNTILFEHTYECNVKQLKQTKLVAKTVREHQDWIETETIHEPMFTLKLSESNFHRLLEDVSGTMWEREIKKKHTQVEQAYQQYLILLNLYR